MSSKMDKSITTITELRKRTVYVELLRLGIPPEVASEANGVYEASNKHLGSNDHNSSVLLYDCCYKAYMNLNIAINPVALGKKFSLSSKKSTSIKDEKVFISPSVYVDEAIVVINKDDMKSNLVTAINKLCILIDSCPPPVTSIVGGVAATVLFFETLNPNWWDAAIKKEMIAVSGSSAATIKNAIKMIKGKHLEEMKVIIKAMDSDE